jgi:hypothetical protein
MLKVLRDREFPKRNKKARINFLADSLAAKGAVTPRTSRDICARARKRERKKSAPRIIFVMSSALNALVDTEVRRAITLVANAEPKLTSAYTN